MIFWRRKMRIAVVQSDDAAENIYLFQTKRCGVQQSLWRLQMHVTLSAHSSAESEGEKTIIRSRASEFQKTRLALPGEMESEAGLNL